MSVQRFVGKTSRAVLKDVRLTLGDDAVIISNRTTRTGVEVLAMAGNEMEHLVENADSAISRPASRLSQQDGSREEKQSPDELARMSKPGQFNTDRGSATQSNAMLLGQPETFEAYLKRARGSQINASSTVVPARPATQVRQPRASRAAAEYESIFSAQMDDPETVPPVPEMSTVVKNQRYALRNVANAADSNDAQRAKNIRHAGMTMVPAATQPHLTSAQSTATRSSNTPSAPIIDSDLMSEMKSMKGLLQNQLAHFAFSDMARKNPVQGKILAKLLHAGFSPVLTRALAEKIVVGINEAAAEVWIAQALRQNLRCAKPGDDMLDRGGVYALVGPTGVGKTTTTAKLAARCAIKHGVKKLGLITIDGYRMGAQDQLKSFGKILGCPVHIAHDQSSLNDLLVTMRDRHLVLIDTVGMPQRDPRMNEQLSLLMAPGIERVMVLNAASQAETLEDVVQAWVGPRCRRALMTRLDEAVKLGGVIDTAIRHQLTIDFVANGQRVPEDIHLANANLLIHRALRAAISPMFHFKPDELAMMAVPFNNDSKGMQNA